MKNRKDLRTVEDVISKRLGLPLTERREVHWRKLKRYESKMYHSTQIAYYCGEAARRAKKEKSNNPYPKGERHKAWNDGYETAKRFESTPDQWPSFDNTVTGE